MHSPNSAPLRGSENAQAHLSHMFTAIISKLDRDSRENLCHVLHHCHTRLSPRTHLPIMFFSERDDVTYAIAAPHLSEQQNTVDPPNSKLCQNGQHTWSDAQHAAIRVLKGAGVPDVYMHNHSYDNQQVQPARRAFLRQREGYSAYAPPSMNDSDDDHMEDFEDDLSYDSYISDSKMSDVTEEAREYEEHCRTSIFGSEIESQVQCSPRH